MLLDWANASASAEERRPNGPEEKLQARPASGEDEREAELNRPLRDREELLDTVHEKAERRLADHESGLGEAETDLAFVREALSPDNWPWLRSGCRPRC